MSVLEVCRTGEDVRWIPEFEGRYEVDTSGRVYSHISHKYLRPRRQSNGYLTVGLTGEQGHSKTHLISRLVLLTFVGPGADGAQAAHRDRDITNNSLANLMWATPSENNMHKHLHGTMPIGEQHHMAYLSDGQVEVVRAAFRAGVSVRALSREMGVPYQTLEGIQYGYSRRFPSRP